jgi:hypothetical protein
MALVRLRAAGVRLDPGQPVLWMLEGPEMLNDLERRMALVKAGARSKVGRRTGLLYSTIRTNNGASKRGPYVDVIAGMRGGKTRYLMPHHDGSRPHVIARRRRKALRFVVAGRIVFRTRVMHPGTTGTRFLTDSLPLAAG